MKKKEYKLIFSKCLLCTSLYHSYKFHFKEFKIRWKMKHQEVMALVCMSTKSLSSCLTRDAMNYSSPGSSVHTALGHGLIQDYKIDHFGHITLTPKGEIDFSVIQLSSVAQKKHLCVKGWACIRSDYHRQNVLS